MATALPWVVSDTDRCLIANSPLTGAVAHTQILDAAENLFYLEGASNVGIDAVVKRAGVNKISLYRQFESKEDLLQHYLVRTDQKFWAYFDASIDKHPGDPRHQLRQIFVDLAQRTSATSYRGCPFVNVAVTQSCNCRRQRMRSMSSA